MKAFLIMHPDIFNIKDAKYHNWSFRRSHPVFFELMTRYYTNTKWTGSLKSYTSIPHDVPAGVVTTLLTIKSNKKCFAGCFKHHAWNLIHRSQSWSIKEKKKVSSCLLGLLYLSPEDIKISIWLYVFVCGMGWGGQNLGCGGCGGTHLQPVVFVLAAASHGLQDL